MQEASSQDEDHTFPIVFKLPMATSLQAACCVVSSRSWPAFDAYVLSESSLFVYSTKIVLKTCGTTRLLETLPELLSLAASLNMQPRRCKFSRASYLFPELQVRHNNHLVFCRSKDTNVAISTFKSERHKRFSVSYRRNTLTDLDLACSLSCTAASPQRLKFWISILPSLAILAPMSLAMTHMGCSGTSMWPPQLMHP